MVEINSYTAESVNDLRWLWREYRLRFKKEIAKDKHVVLRSMKTNVCIYASGSWGLYDFQLRTNANT